jgi:catechol 2,3-dioxygenase-like lactoylglutathione lyase family enzyme
MPRIAGQVVILTVSDADRSAAWYCDLLGMDETSRYVQPDGHVALVHLAERFSDRPPSTNSGSGWITWSSWWLTAMNLTPGWRAWTSWEYAIPASRSPPTPPTPWSPSAIQTTSSLNSSGDRPGRDQAFAARPGACLRAPAVNGVSALRPGGRRPTMRVVSRARNRGVELIWGCRWNAGRRQVPP